MIHGTKLVLGTMEKNVPLSEEEQIRLYRKIGFDGFFTGWQAGKDVLATRALADETGMLYQSIHAPFVSMRHMWYPSEKTEAALSELLLCLEDCARAKVPLMIVHAFIGFHDHTPTKEGLENYRRVVSRAEELSVKIAFENTEGEEYLAALMEEFRDSPAVGFCWDTGHEMCYNRSKDMLALYGDRLFGTHINDNLGVRDPKGEITFYDDLHLLPFDGVGNFEDIAARLCRHGFTDVLTFELSRKPVVNGVCPYEDMTEEAYFSELYARASRLAELCASAK